MRTWWVNFFRPYCSLSLLYITNITASLLYFVRGGFVDLSRGSLRVANSNGYYWSATTYPSTTDAYILRSDGAGVLLSNSSYRFHGFLVRGGYVYLGAGSLEETGLGSLYWSSTTYPNATYAYYLTFNRTTVNQSYYNSRYYGFSVHVITSHNSITPTALKAPHYSTPYQVPYTLSAADTSFYILVLYGV